MTTSNRNCSKKQDGAPLSLCSAIYFPAILRAISFVTVPYELFLVVSSIILYSMSYVSSITMQYVQCHVLLGNYLFLVVPFVTAQ